MNKEIQKNREALIRYFYSLPKAEGHKMNMYAFEGSDTCLCAKGQVMKKFYGMTKYEGECESDYAKDTQVINLPKNISSGQLSHEVSDSLGMDLDVWDEMERIYEGYNRHSGYREREYSQIADWLQTLPGWPKIL